MKQTAVEWLFEQLDITQGYESAIELLNQAKEMEKKQIIEVAMYHRDSSVKRECIESYINKTLNQNKMNKTALDWLRQELEYLREFEQFYNKRYQEFDELFNKAKQIEKEQIIEAFDEGQNNPYEYSEDNEVNWYNGRKYYNETFKAE